MAVTVQLSVLAIFMSGNALAWPFDSAARCDPALPKKLLSFCQATLDKNPTEMTKHLAANLSVVFTKFSGPDCKPAIREIRYSANAPEIEGILKAFATSIHRDLENEKADNPHFGKMSTGRYGTAMMGDCRHETSVTFAGPSASVTSIHLSDER